MAKPPLAWDPTSFHKGIESSISKENLDQLLPALDSLQRRYYYARFHFNEIKKLLAKRQELLAGYISPEARVIQASIIRREQHWSDTPLDAHIISFCQSVHAVTDMICVVIHKTLQLPQEESKDYINERSVKAALKERLKDNLELKQIKLLVEGFSENNDYSKLDFLTNSAKHNTIYSPIFDENKSELILKFPSKKNHKKQKQRGRDHPPSIFRKSI